MIKLGINVELVNAAGTAAEFEAMAARAENLSRPLGLLGLHHVQKAARIIRSGERGIESRSDQLARSLTFQPDGDNGMEVGSNKIYAGPQQSGPAGGFFESSRPNGLLAIPIADNLGARSQARYNSPRDVPDGFFVRTAKYLLFVRRRTRKPSPVKGKRSAFQRGIAAAMTGYREALEVLFLLVDRVPGRAHNYATHDPGDQEAWERFAADWILMGK